MRRHDGPDKALAYAYGPFRPLCRAWEGRPPGMGCRGLRRRLQQGASKGECEEIARFHSNPLLQREALVNTFLGGKEA